MIDCQVVVDINSSPKTKLAFLYSLISGMPEIADLARKNFTLLERSLTGGIILPAEDQYALAVNSISCSDVQLAREAYCDRIVVQAARDRLIACISSALHPNLFGEVTLSESQSHYVALLESAKEELFLDRAQIISEDPKYHKATRNFFSSYAENFGVRQLFQEQNIQLGKQEEFDFNRATRYFLNPETKPWKGFPLVLRRYLFGKILNTYRSNFIIAERIDDLASLNIPYKDPRYYRWNRIMRAHRRGNLPEEINLLAGHVAAGNTLKQLNRDYPILSDFIYNLFLIDMTVETGRDLSIQALTKTPAELLRQIRKLAN